MGKKDEVASTRPCGPSTLAVAWLVHSVPLQRRSTIRPGAVLLKVND